VILPSVLSNHHHTIVFDRPGRIVEFTEHLTRSSRPAPTGGAASPRFTSPHSSRLDPFVHGLPRAHGSRRRGVATTARSAPGDAALFRRNSRSTRAWDAPRRR
jgi:hypothetical protein